MNLCDFKKNRTINSVKEIFSEHKTYAIILSSPSLLESENGNFIDSHDYVIRFNFAPTKNFEKYVGSKTTHRFLGGCRGLATYYREPQDVKVIRWVLGDKCKQKHGDNSDLRYVEQDFAYYKESEDFFINFHYMPCGVNCYKYNAGYKILSIMNYSNNKINIFGYNNKRYHQYHYYNDGENARSAAHIMHKYNLSNPWKLVVNSASIKVAYKNHPYVCTNRLVEKLIIEKKINII